MSPQIVQADENFRVPADWRPAVLTKAEGPQELEISVKNASDYFIDVIALNW
jgi:hypothetical protein